MSDMIRLLIADDDKNLRRILAAELSEGGVSVDVAGTGSEAMELVETREYDVVLLDLSMPGLTGIEVLTQIRAREIPVEVIILTAHGTVSTAVEAMKLGAYDFLTKPFKLEEVRVVVGKAYEKKDLLRENLRLREQLKRQFEPPQMVARSRAMQAILEQVKRIGPSDFPVLIEGESGVGKELVARAVHDASARKQGPFIPINCGAIPENMLENELFGHERGAFTSAGERKPGLLEIANRGTLFLDEICELGPPLQVKLLRVIETGRFFRLGGTKEISVDVRFISATNRDAKGEVGKGTFRSDLYYRLTSLTLHVPPLRERIEDIPHLIEHIVSGSPLFRGKTFSAEALRVLSSYPWPGNVRELQNVVHRTLLLSEGDLIEAADLPCDMVECLKLPGKRLDDVEREHILRVLREVSGHRGRAAVILGVDPKTLYRKLQSYGVGE